MLFLTKKLFAKIISILVSTVLITGMINFSNNSSSMSDNKVSNTISDSNQHKQKSQDTDSELEQFYSYGFDQTDQYSLNISDIYKFSLFPNSNNPISSVVELSSSQISDNNAINIISDSNQYKQKSQDADLEQVFIQTEQLLLNISDMYKFSLFPNSNLSFSKHIENNNTITTNRNIKINTNKNNKLSSNKEDSISIPNIIENPNLSDNIIYTFVSLFAEKNKLKKEIDHQEYVDTTFYMKLHCILQPLLDLVEKIDTNRELIPQLEEKLSEANEISSMKPNDVADTNATGSMEPSDVADLKARLRKARKFTNIQNIQSHLIPLKENFLKQYDLLIKNYLSNNNCIPSTKITQMIEKNRESTDVDDLIELVYFLKNKIESAKLNLSQDEQELRKMDKQISNLFEAFMESEFWPVIDISEESKNLCLSLNKTDVPSNFNVSLNTLSRLVDNVYIPNTTHIPRLVLPIYKSKRDAINEEKQQVEKKFDDIVEQIRQLESMTNSIKRFLIQKNKVEFIIKKIDSMINNTLDSNLITGLNNVHAYFSKQLSYIKSTIDILKDRQRDPEELKPYFIDYKNQLNILNSNLDFLNKIIDQLTNNLENDENALYYTTSCESTSNLEDDRSSLYYTTSCESTSNSEDDRTPSFLRSTSNSEDDSISSFLHSSSYSTSNSDEHEFSDPSVESDKQFKIRKLKQNIRTVKADLLRNKYKSTIIFLTPPFTYKEYKYLNNCKLNLSLLKQQLELANTENKKAKLNNYIAQVKQILIGFQEEKDKIYVKKRNLISNLGDQMKIYNYSIETMKKKLKTLEKENDINLSHSQSQNDENILNSDSLSSQDFSLVWLLEEDNVSHENLYSNNNNINSLPVSIVEIKPQDNSVSNKKTKRSFLKLNFAENNNSEIYSTENDNSQICSKDLFSNSIDNNLNDSKSSKDGAM